MIKAILVSLCDAWLLLNMDTLTNPERDFLVVFMVILLFINTFDYFLEIPDGWLFFDFIITTLVLEGLYGFLQLMCNATAVQG